MAVTGKKVVIGVVFYNEAEKMPYFLFKFLGLTLPVNYHLLFVNDGSTDGSERVIKTFFEEKKFTDYSIISSLVNKGVGHSIREVIHYGLKNKFDICTIMAGNGKDDPHEISKLLEPILNEDYDYIQGSRFLEGGSFKNLPFMRKLFILGFTLVTSLFTWHRCTDSSNGFRAYKLAIFKDKRINIDQEWLDRYELETYLHYKVLTLGYKVKEVAVSKNYLPHIKNYSKIRPFIDWWRMSRPIFLLKFGLRR